MPIEPDDAFILRPGEPHQIGSDSTEDLVLHVILDNQKGESCHNPDRNKWRIPIPERRLVCSDRLDYYDGGKNEIAVEPVNAPDLRSLLRYRGFRQIRTFEFLPMLGRRSVWCLRSYCDAGSCCCPKIE